MDSIISFAIDSQAFPGCVVYAARQGQPFFFKAYGHHTYDSLQETTLTDLFDLASLTKVTAATLALMKLYEEGLIRLDDRLRDHVDGLWLNKRGKVTIRECLAHQSGLQSWIKYYELIRKKNRKYRNRTIASAPSDAYPYQLAEGMYLHRNFYRQIKKYIKKCRFDRDQGYVYSGLFFYLVPEIVENLSGVPYDEFLRYHFYDSLGAETLCYNPLERFSPDRIVPTEVDTFFRMQPIHGRVHDEGAIMMQGVSGNAGLFGNAEDLAKVWQMLLNEGEYNGKRYLHPATIDLFTSYQYPAGDNRRGLGFDKPLLTYDEELSSVAASASTYSFGHTGFTGTLAWADPKHDLLFIFLSNRVYPTRDHRSLYTCSIRPQIQQLLYDYLCAMECGTEEKPNCTGLLSVKHP